MSDVGRRTAIGASWLIAWRMVTRALGLISTLVLARILVPADFGLVAMATTFSAAIDSFSELGLLDALVRRPDTGRGLYDTAFTMQALRGLLTGAVIAGGAPLVDRWFGQPRLLPILLVLAALSVLSGLENIGIVEFRRSLRFSMEFKLLFMPRIAQFVVTIALALLLQSYWALIIGIAVNKLARLVMTYVVHPYRPRLALSRWRDLVGFSFWTWASSLSSQVWDKSDPFILGRTLGAGDLGVYLLAAEIAVLPVTELVAPASRALFAGFAAAQHEGTDTVKVAIPVVVAMLLIVVPLTLGVSATSGYLVAILLGPKWTAAQPLIAIFAWLCIFSPFSWVSTTVLMARGFVRQNFYAVTAAALLKAVLIYIASLTGRIDVVAATAVVVVAIESLLFTTMLKRCGNARWRDSTGALCRIGASTVATVAMLYASGMAWQPVSLSTGPALLQGMATGIAAVLVFLTLQFGGWWIAKRPDGPERKVMELAGGLVGRLRPAH